MQPRIYLVAPLLLLLAPHARAQAPATPATAQPAAVVQPAPAQESPPAAQPETEAEAQLSDRPEDEKAIRDLLRQLVTAYNAGDAQAFVPFLMEDAVTTDCEEVSTRGREAIVAQYAEAFSEGPTAQIEGTSESLEFYSPEVARLEGSFSLTAPPESEGAEPTVQTGRFCVLAVKQDNGWLLAEIRDIIEPEPEPESNFDMLQELAWLEGDWIDESEGVRIKTSVRWAEGGNFLVRAYDVEIDGETAMTGTQWIGWDPRTGQIRSWAFDSQGGFGEGVWVRQGDQWVVKAQGVLRDGLPTSATQIVTRMSDDLVRLSSLDRIVGGVIMPDLEEVVMVRQAPEPALGDEPDAAAPEAPAATEPAAAPEAPVAPSAPQAPATGAAK